MIKQEFVLRVGFDLFDTFQEFKFSTRKKLFKFCEQNGYIFEFVESKIVGRRRVYYYGGF